MQDRPASIIPATHRKPVLRPQAHGVGCASGSLYRRSIMVSVTSTADLSRLTFDGFTAAAHKWREIGDKISSAYYDGRRSALIFSRTITLCSRAPVQPHFRIAELVPALEPLKTKQLTFLLSVSDYLHAIEFATSVAGNPVAWHVSVPASDLSGYRRGVYRISQAGAKRLKYWIRPPSRLRVRRHRRLWRTAY